MTLEELQRMPKFDTHAHIRGPLGKDEGQFLALLKKHNLKWLDICVVGTEWEKLKQKIALAEMFHEKYSKNISWATSFNLENWGDKIWRQAALEAIGQGFAGGAVAVKVWKEIGMVLKDPNGRYVMIDDARFNPILEFIQNQDKTLVAHIGEPRNCWLPLEAMTVEGDRNYYREHPQYHAFLHPEIPTYWDQIKARDKMLEKHPQLRVVGCHLGSLEFDVEELAKRLDKYPNFAVDMAARIVHFQVQDQKKVRDFILKYQDRLLYATDSEIGVGDGESDIPSQLSELETVYQRDYRYFATDQMLDVAQVRADFKAHGLALPRGVLKKIYFENAKKWYRGI
jgi:predicted TIM-barrel fold metal-dependent hydrolase